MLFHGQEDHGHAIGARLRQPYPQFSALAGEKDVRNLNQDACAIAGLRVATRRAAMSEVDENLNALADNLVAFHARNAGDQSHAAGIVLIPWMIETLRWRSAETMIGCMHGNLFDEPFSVQNALHDPKTQTHRDSFRWKPP